MKKPKCTREMSQFAVDKIPKRDYLNQMKEFNQHHLALLLLPQKSESEEPLEILDFDGAVIGSKEAFTE